MRIADIVDHPDWIATLVTWAMREWPARSPGEKPEARRKRLVGELQRDRLPICLVAEEGGTPIGYVSVIHYILGGQEHQQHWIDAVYVEPPYRKHGLGAQLLREAERRARALGVETLYVLTTLPAWYNRQGWHYTDQTSADMALLQKTL